MKHLRFLRYGDLDLDLAVAVTPIDSAGLFFNVGDGSFQNAVSCEAGDSPGSTFCADLGQDVDHD